MEVGTAFAVFQFADQCIKCDDALLAPSPEICGIRFLLAKGTDESSCADVRTTATRKPKLGS